MKTKTKTSGRTSLSNFSYRMHPPRSWKLLSIKNWHIELLVLLVAFVDSSLCLTAESNTHSLTTLQTGVNTLSPLSAAFVASSILEKFTPNCSSVAHVFVAKGFSAADVPLKPSSEVVLRYCESSSVGTCCTYSMETKMAMQSRFQLENKSKEQISRLSTILRAKAHKFNDVFQTMLLESKKEFHNMFTRTYGVIYQQNSYVFSDLFSELENFYARGGVDLIEVMDKFFNTLYQKMFQVLNAQYSFNEKYLICVSEHMKELKPFGDVPDKLSIQIKRSFVATRTYGLALTTAAEVTRKLVNIRLNADCTTALTKMQHCGSCKGYSEKPCNNYCINVIKGCLHYFNELDTEWDNFSSAMDRVAERLLGSFNIVMVVEPINIKISEAIMNFQDSGRDITNRVFQGCGRPTLGRQNLSLNPRWSPQIESETKVIVKRSTLQADFDPVESDILDIDASLDDAIVLREKRGTDSSTRQDVNLSVEQSLESHGKAEMSGGSGRRYKKKQQQNRNNEESDYAGRDPILDKLVRDIRQRIKESKKFWANLPNQICTTEEITSLSTDTDNMCWNGHTIDRYMHSVISEHGRNPEFPGNPATTRQTAMVTTQLFHLKNAIGHLRNAYNGQDVEWNDQDNPYYGSGSGSGGGVDDEDDEREGSGLSGNSFLTNQEPDLEHKVRPAVRINEDDDDEDRNPISPHTSQPKHVGTLTFHEQESNGFEEDADNNTVHGKKNSVEPVRRALMIYLLPLFMSCFGVLYADLL